MSPAHRFHKVIPKALWRQKFQCAMGLSLWQIQRTQQRLLEAQEEVRSHFRSYRRGTHPEVRSSCVTGCAVWERPTTWHKPICLLPAAVSTLKWTPGHAKCKTLLATISVQALATATHELGHWRRALCICEPYEGLTFFKNCNPSLTFLYS